MIEGAPGADEDAQVGEATAYLELHGVPANARAFRLRQEFFRHNWDVRVRDEGGVWWVRASKPGLPNIEARGASEGVALRLGLARAIGHDQSRVT